MNSCPKCQRTDRQNRAGKTKVGSQRYRWIYSHIKYTPVPKEWAYDEQTRQKVLEMHVDEMNLRRIARHLGTHHRTISLWVKDKAASLPKAPFPIEVKDAEMDELFTFIGEKKQIYIITIVDRVTRCFLGYKVVGECTQQFIQDVVDEAIKAKQYHSDAFDAYDRLWYHYGRYEVSDGKIDTYSVEGVNAELCHYLARLARRSRCFS
jgi:IS1 family transposase